MKQKIDITLMKFLIVVILAPVVSSCVFSNREPNSTQNIPKEVPMSEFILGNWVSKNAYDFEGRESSYKYELEVVDENTLKFSVLSLEGNFLDGATSQYSFTNTNTIFIDNRRIQDGEAWLLEKDGQNLIVYRTIANKTDRIIFIRRTNK
jgi:hypothetical protein